MAQKRKSAVKSAPKPPKAKEAIVAQAVKKPVLYSKKYKCSSVNWGSKGEKNVVLIPWGERPAAYPIGAVVPFEEKEKAIKLFFADGEKCDFEVGEWYVVTI